MAFPLARPARAGLLLAIVATLAALAGCGGSQHAGSVDVSVEGTAATTVTATVAPVPLITFVLGTPYRAEPTPAPLIPLPVTRAVAPPVTSAVTIPVVVPVPVAPVPVAPIPLAPTES
jgi:hypothetical protein